MTAIEVRPRVSASSSEAISFTGRVISGDFAANLYPITFSSHIDSQLETYIIQSKKLLQNA
jgi:hypothetical protein